MASYKLSNVARADLIRIHQYDTKRFGESQADKYFEAFFDCFEQIATRPYAYESVDYIKLGYRRCVCSSDTIYFRINVDVVEIMTIIGKQDFNQL